MQQEYNPAAIEASVQKIWQDEKVFKVAKDANKEKFYCLAMLPYPSGRLHMGHVRNYTIGDVISRYQRMLGKNVLQPMGWDAFGLPAENAAIKNKAQPGQWTEENIAYMKKQLQSLGFAYDWDREVTTCKPEYYRWEQWFFTQLVKQGLAYKKRSSVNWCPNDETVLANEQVHEGCCWRCDTPVVKKQIDQWFLRITDYAEELLQSLDDLPGWPESVKTQQRHWIGRSEGVELIFKMQNCQEQISVYTTRPDTLMGVTYVALAAGHPIATKAAENNPALAKFIRECNQSTTAEADMATMPKKGMATGLQAIHPVSGEEIPVWVANFVLMDYGSGAVMSVPAHDQRDWEFARKYNLPIKQVIQPVPDSQSVCDLTAEAFSEKGVLINSAEFNDLTSEEAFAKIASWLADKKLGRKTINYRLRDWGVSRQRFWGAPIPMIKLESGEMVAAKEFPVELPTDLIMQGTTSPLIDNADFQDVVIDGKKGKRETDTFDTFMESSWYYARYTCPHSHDAMLDSDQANYWLPVDQYVGGIEHATMHLLYFRFFHKLMRDAGLVNSDEPATRLLTQGMVLSDTFISEDEKGVKHYHAIEDVAVKKDSKGKIISGHLKATGQPVILAGMEKMSKSKNNGVDPQTLIEQYGADTVRLYTMFAAPPEQSLEWRDDGVNGAYKFIKRLWNLTIQHLQQADQSNQQQPIKMAELSDQQKQLYAKTHQTIAKVTDDFARRHSFNTAIAATMELINSISKFAVNDKKDQQLMNYALDKTLIMLSPIIPHMTQALWQLAARKNLIVDESWPKVDEAALIKEQLVYMLQVNGKLRGKIQVDASTAQQEVESLAKQHENVAKFIQQKTIRKIIFVAGRLVNIVAN